MTQKMLSMFEPCPKCHVQYLITYEDGTAECTYCGWTGFWGSEDLEKLSEMEEPTNPNAKIPWCNLGYTVQQSQEKCPLEGCWKFRCFSSKLHDGWSKGRTEWRNRRRR